MIEEHKKRKKIFYVPGMISLVLIPFVFIVYFYKTDAFKVEGAIEFNMPNKEDFEKYKVATLRSYKTYKFNGKELDDKEKLNEIRFYLRKLINEKDTVNGIKLEYDVKTQYDVFIKMIDILVIEDAPTWGIFGNDVYIIAANNKPKKIKNDNMNHTAMNCGTMEVMRRLAYWERKNKKEEEERVFQASFFQDKWISIFLGYFSIVLLNIFTLVKFNKNR